MSALHYTTLQYTTLQYPTLHYTNYTTPQLQLQLQLHYTNYITPQLQLHYTTLQLQLHHIIYSSCGEVTPENTSPTTFRSISGFALPSVIHNNEPLL